MFLLDTTKLRAGDIVLSTRNAKSARSLRKIMRSTFSHAMLYVADSSVIHADLDGTHAESTQRLLFESPDHAMVLRPIQVRHRDQLHKACEHARSLVGARYSKIEAAAAVVNRGGLSRARTLRQFCSRLVAQSYAAAGIPLVLNIDYCYPGDLFNIELVDAIPDPLRPASSAEIAFGNSPSPITEQKRITNGLMQAYRSTSGEMLENDEQVIECLVRRPELDRPFSDALVTSGYLELWRRERRVNAWRYDISILKAAVPNPAARRRLQSRELASAREAHARFLHMYATYEALAQVTPRRFFVLLSNLYDILVTLADDWIEVSSSADA